MSRTLFVTDLDGTFLGADAQVSRESSRLVNEAVERGALFTVATARTPATVVPLLQHTLTSAPAIVMTGAALWLRDEARYANAQFVAPEDVDLVCRVLEAHGCHPFIYALTPDGLLHVYHGAKRLKRIEQRFVDERQGLALKRFYLNARLVACERDSVILLFAMGDLAGIGAAARELQGMTDASVSFYTDTYNPNVGLIEVFAPGVSKAEAVLRLKKDMGADRLVVFGDNLNDLPMMAVADHAVAVANALPEVRAAAHEVIGANTTDAVARYVRLKT